MTTPEPERQGTDGTVEDGPTAWFEPLYAAAARGETTVPWDRHAPHWLLTQWAGQRTGPEGHRAVVVGCGTGDDAEYVVTLGFDDTAFDVSSSAIEAARQRYPGSVVDYVTADLFALPRTWPASFDLVDESQTVQALPRSLREAATHAIASLVAPNGTLVVLAAMGRQSDPARPGPPWPLTLDDMERFATTGLETVGIDEVPDPHQPGVRRWCAEFRRPA